MAYSILNYAFWDRMSRDLKKTYYLAIILVLIPVIFISLGTTLSVVKTDSNEYLINFYSHNSSALEINRYSQSTALDEIKYKRVTLSAPALLHDSKFPLSLKHFKDKFGLSIFNDLSVENFKYKYLLSDLPPPSNTI
jgi:hypothetical protein